MTFRLALETLGWAIAGCLSGLAIIAAVLVVRELLRIW